MTSDVEGVLIPSDLEAFAASTAKQTEDVLWLLECGRSLVESVERLVCRLYGVPAELEDDVVASAVARAASRVGSGAAE
ncbi:MAG: hypothetical protein WD649_05635 [Thermoleophilaceae bacterium]